VSQEQQRESDREALKQERKRRRDLERRLAEEMKKNNESMENTIKLREKQKVQVSTNWETLSVMECFISCSRLWCLVLYWQMLEPNY